MGLINQAAASVPQTADKGLISFWVRPPAATFTNTGDFIPILEFGTRETRTSLIWIQSNGFNCEIWSKPFTGTFEVARGRTYADWIIGNFVGGAPSMAGQYFSNPVVANAYLWRGYYFFNNSAAWVQALNDQQTTGVFKPLWDDHVFNTTPPNLNITGGDKIGGLILNPSTSPTPDDDEFRARLTFQQTYRDTPNYGTIVPDKWNHIIVAWDSSGIASVESTVDATGGITTSLVSSQYLWASVNDVDISFRKISINQGPVVDVDPGQILPNGGYTSSGEFILIDEIEWMRQLNIGDPPQATEFPEWEADLDGQEIGIPTQSVGAFGGKIEMAYFQMWLGKSVDTSVLANRRKFIKSDRRPTRWRSAWSTLGTPNYAMRRGKSFFKTNEGSGGNFDVVGTLNDYTPGPDTGPLYA